MAGVYNANFVQSRVGAHRLCRSSDRENTSLHVQDAMHATRAPPITCVFATSLLASVSTTHLAAQTQTPNS